MTQLVTKGIADAAVDKDKINADVAGNGVAGGAGSALAVDPDTTGGAGLAEAINVSANGVAVKVDDSTLEDDGSGNLRVKPDGIGAAELDETDNFTMSGTSDFQTGTVHVPTPTAPTHPVTKAYSDSQAEGMPPKANVRALADSNITLSGDPTSVDGVTGWSTGDRILPINQTSADENGIWEVNTAGAWTRPADFDTGDHAAGAATFVNAGTNYKDQVWRCITDAPNDIIDTNDLTFEIFGRLSDLVAGVGLTKDGNTIRVGDGSTGNSYGINYLEDELRVAVDDVTIGITGSHTVTLKDDAVTAAKIDDAAVIPAAIHTSVAGDGLAKNGTTGALDLRISDLDTEAIADADLLAFSDATDSYNCKKITKANLLAGIGETPRQEAHKITSGEVTAGYFTLANTPATAGNASAFVVGGINQVNKQIVGATGVTPDFDILTSNQFHFKNVVASGLTGDINVDDVVVVQYAS